MKKIRLFTATIILLQPLIIKAQDVLNFSVAKTFTQASIYDFDLKRFTSDPVYVNTDIKVDVSDKTGRIVFFTQKKNAFAIKRAYHDYDNYSKIILECSNYNGRAVTIIVALTSDGNNVRFVQVENDADNTAIIYE